jgi:hypothetical protein
MNTRCLILAVLLAVLFFTVIPSGAHASAQVVINEILASNSTGIVDEDGDPEPWIELYNKGDEAVELAGFGLSDDDERPWRWIFPDTTIAPGEYLLVFASGKDRAKPGRAMHAGFRVSRFGEPVSLTDINGRVLDRVPPVELPVDVSYGRLPDGADNWVFFDRPTPGYSNTSDGYDEILDPPVFSREGGFYTYDFDLYLDAGASGSGFFSGVDGSPGSSAASEAGSGLGTTASTMSVHIRYTLDGSEPDSSSPLADGPIRITDRTPEPNGISAIPTSPPEIPLILGYKWHHPQGQVFKGTVVRARAFREGGKPSPVATHTYFVDSRGGTRYHLPVVSLSTDSLHLFDHETGIYIPGIHFDLGGPEDDPKKDEPHLFGNYVQRGIEWERPASMEFFDEQGERVFAQDIGIRIHGGRSRSLPLKSLRLYARSDYGESRFNYPFFPDLPYRDYNRLILRNSGQDFFGRSTMFRDGFMQTLVRDLNMDTQEYRATVVFINGEFWGIMNIRERYDEDYLARTWGVDPDNVDLLQNNMEPKAGDSLHYSAMMDFIEENDPASREVYDQIRTMMDIDNYLDYIIAQMIIRNVDWPGNNIEYWRLRTDWNPDAPPGHDGRWRWMVVDMDAGFGLLNPWRVASFDMVRHMTNDKYDGFSNDPWSTVLIRRLLRNDEFRNEFIRRSADYLNTIFLPGHVIAMIDRFEESLEPVIEEHILRWGQIESKSRWHFNVERMRDFAKRRPGYVREHLMDFFGLEEMFRLQVDVSAMHKGRVQVNHLTIDENTPGTAGRESPWPWTGTYFTGIPLDLKARAYSGYRFSHWEEYDPKTREVTRIHSWQEQIRIHNGKDMGLRAVFVPSSEAPELIPEPHVLMDGPYHFRAWEPDAEPGSFPDNMAFQYMADPDPGLRSPAAGFTGGAYDLESRTRINGLGDGGFAFLNTSSTEGNPGYPGARLGAAVLALDTRGMKNIRVNWTGGTVQPNYRIYHLRLQYRINGEGEYRDVTDEWGEPVEYQRHHQAGHSRRFEDIKLSQAAWNKPYVELRWKYYYTGEQVTTGSGARAQLRVGDITVAADPMLVHEGEEITGPQIRQNYPNPFNNTTNIRIFLPEETQVSVSLFDVSGRLVRRVREHMRLSAGYHTIRVDAGDLAGGIYVYRVDTPGWTAHGKMTLIR